MSVTVRIRRKSGSDLLADYMTGLYDLTRGDSQSITLRFPGGGQLDDLVVTGTYTVPSGTTETYDVVQIQNGGTLIIEDGASIYCNRRDNDGTVDNDGLFSIGSAVLGGDAWVEMQQTADFGGEYTINESLNSQQRYTERIPSGADVDSLVVGIEPSAELQNNDVTGIWALVDGGTDERNTTLSEWQYTVDVTVLAELSEYSTLTDLENGLKL